MQTFADKTRILEDHQLINEFTENMRNPKNRRINNDKLLITPGFLNTAGGVVKRANEVYNPSTNVECEEGTEMPDVDERLRFSGEYAALRLSRGTSVREKGKEEVAINERLVACLWYSQRYSKNLKTVDGRAVEVISPGIWGLEGGPDFTQAAIRLDDGKPIKGDVEIHLYASDWKGHQHHRKEQFNNVVLNVSMWNDVKSRSLPTFSGRKIPHVELKPFLTRSIESIVNLVQTDDYPYRRNFGTGRCAEVLGSLSKNEVFRLLQMAGEWRMQEKSSRLEEWLSQNDFDELLYKALMEAMGYHNNKESFIYLAERITYKDLRRLVKSLTDRYSHYLPQSVLVNLSGLFPDKSNSTWDVETKKFHRFIRAIWLDFLTRKTYLPVDKARWNLRGRPSNSPLRRIAGMSLFIYEHRAGSPFGRILSAFQFLGEVNTKFRDEYNRFTKNLIADYYAVPDPRLKKQYQNTLKRLMKIIQTGEDKYWSRHYSLGGKKLSKHCALIGQARLNEIIVNVIIPMLLLYSRKYAHEMENLLYIFSQFLPGLPDNKITRLMKYRLFGKDGRKLPPESAITQQGLLQLFKDFCSHDKGGCLDCEFIRNVQQWIDYRSAKS